MIVVVVILVLVALSLIGNVLSAGSMSYKATLDIKGTVSDLAANVEVLRSAVEEAAAASAALGASHSQKPPPPNANRKCSKTEDTPPNAWLHWGGDSSNSRASRTSGINARNVHTLVHSWSFETRGGHSGGPSCDTRACYISDNAGWVYKIDAVTGTLIWNVSLSAFGSPASRSRNVPVVYRGKVLLGDRTTGSGRVWALSSTTGALLWTSVVETHPGVILTTSGTPACGMWILGVSSNEELLASNPSYPCCSFRGSVLAIDVETGQILWKTFMIPEGYAGAAVWGSSPSIDYARRRVYISTGNLYPSNDNSVYECVENATEAEQDYRECFEPGVYNTVRFNSIVALDIDTGAVEWSTQLGGWDVWTVACILRDYVGIPAGPNACPETAGADWDFGQAPILFTSASGVDLVAAGQKSGGMWALRADNGSIVWANASGLGSEGGGYMFGSAIDNARLYGLDANSIFRPWNDTVTNQTHCGSRIVAHDRNTGRPLWTAALPSQPPSQVCALAAVNPFGPSLLYYRGPFNPVGPASHTQTGAVSVAAADQPRLSVVFAADSYATIFALSGSTGELLWSYQIEGENAFSNVVIAGSRVFFATGPDAVTAFGDGKRLHSFQLP